MNNALKRQTGLTLIELMVSVTIGLLLLIAIGTLFVSTRKTNRQNDQQAGMQDRARFVLSTLSRDITMAGYWGGMATVTGIKTDTTTATQNLPKSNDCGANASTAWAFLLWNTTTTNSNRVEFRNDADTTAASSIWNCIGSYRSGTDIVALRRVAGQITTASASVTQTTPGTTANTRVNNFYLKTNGVVGTMVRCLDAGCQSGDNAIEEPLSSPQNFYKYVPRIYFVRSFSRTSGDNVPTLCRKELCQEGFSGSGESATCGGTGSTAGMYSECLADGIEDLQVVWGVDADGDNVVDSYTTRPSAAQLSRNPLTAQISVRVRSLASDASYIDSKSYTAGGITYTPTSDADLDSDGHALAEKDKARHFYRRVYSTTVTLRNPP